MVGGQQRAADRQAERQQAAGLDLDRIGAHQTELFPQQRQPSVVDPAQPFGDRLVASRPVPHGQVERQPVAGQRQLTRQPDPGPRVGLGAVELFEHVVDALALPGVEHRRDERAAVGEEPVETTLGHLERLGEALDPHRVRAAVGQGLQARGDPCLARGARCRHGVSLPTSHHIYGAV
nr:hypothetical protein [Stackebrandtia nassauensis]